MAKSGVVGKWPLLGGMGCGAAATQGGGCIPWSDLLITELPFDFTNDACVGDLVYMRAHWKPHSLAFA